MNKRNPQHIKHYWRIFRQLSLAKEINQGSFPEKIPAYANPCEPVMGTNTTPVIPRL